MPRPGSATWPRNPFPPSSSARETGLPGPCTTALVTSSVTTTPSDRILKLARTPALWPGVKGDQTSLSSAAYNYGYRNHVNYLFSGANKTTVTDNPNERGVAPVLFWDGSVVVNDFRRNPLNFAGNL